MVSPTIQNEIIEAIGHVVQKKIVDRVKLSKFYSILYDETTDVSTVERLTLCIRYVDIPNCVIREDFLGFIKMQSTAGVVIKTAIKNMIESLGSSFENLRGQGYNGDANMSEKIKCSDTSPETSSTATMLESVITKSEFLVVLEMAVTCFLYTLNLSQNLKSKKQDLSKALADVSVVKGGLEAVCEDVDNHFKQIFNDVTLLVSKVNIEIKISRTCGKQTNRVNIRVQKSNPDDYCRISIFIPFLDSIILQLQTRFIKKKLEDIIKLEELIPVNFSLYSNESILQAAKMYENDLLENGLVSLKAELPIWRNRWEDSKLEKSESTIEALRYCSDLLPNMKLLLQLFATLPVLLTTPECTFSNLKFLKNYLRSTMNEEKLNGLAITKINRPEEISEAEVIQIFSSASHRRLLLLD